MSKIKKQIDYESECIKDRILNNSCALRDVSKELKNISNLWNEFNSAHEAFAILAEEIDELWDHVKTKQINRDLPAMRDEAIQVAAVALRFAAEVCSERVGRK